MLLFSAFLDNLSGKHLFFLCLLTSIGAKAQIKPDFTTEIPAGCAPLVIYSFRDLSTGKPVKKWFWDLGNGHKSQQQNPGTTYFNPGTYTVTLTVEDEAGNRYTVSKEKFITVHQKPALNFSANNTSGCVPFTVKFNDQSTAGSGTISKWQWDFGDGNKSLEQSPSHTYVTNGDATITLKVTNSFGCENVETKTSYIHVNAVPHADFTSGSASSCKPPALVSFTSASTSPGIATWKWDFGDGTPGFGATTAHIYTKAGTYAVRLIVTNQNSCSDTITKPTVIGTVTPAFTGPDTVCQSAPAVFVNTSTPAIASAYWNFGDNTLSKDINPVKRFETSGTFPVKLVTDFGACKDSTAKDVVVLPKPVADFSFVAPASTCRLPVDITFRAGSSNAVSYLWNFGDRTASTDINPIHTYNTYDVFSVKLIVSGQNGCTDSVVRQNLISIAPVKIESFAGLPFSGCLPHQQTFSATISSSERVTSYLWNFGDGATSTDISPIHKYTVEGRYNVSLQVTTAGGCTDSLRVTNGVAVFSRPTAKFSADLLSACSHRPVQFTNESKGSITRYFWDFGDATTSDETNPLHHYIDTGFFDIKLTVSNEACIDTATKINYVYIKPPVANFKVLYDCQLPFVRRFENTSIISKTGDHSVYWDFGDGSQSEEANPEHTFKAPGVYYVRVHVTNGDCFDDFADSVRIIDEHPNFSINKNVLCRNNTSVFTATDINPKNIAAYSWNFSDNTPVITTTAPVVKHNYLRPGKYTPSLNITDILGCTRTIENTVSIDIYGPNAGFSNPKGACLNSKVVFTDTSKPTASHPITRWILLYGDGLSDTAFTAPDFSHIYKSPKKYDVSLIVTDSYGCKDTAYKASAINITSPKAAFAASDSISCKNSDINFSNQSSGLNLTFSWDFGDASKSTNQNPRHTFTSEGNHTVSLAVKDLYGCTDTAVHANAVTVGNAQASFTMSDSVISCPPAQVDFKNASTFSTRVKWDFDDGNSSTLFDPSHYFLEARTFHIRLIAYGHGTCSDTTIKDIRVKGPNSSFTYSPLANCVPVAVSFKGRASSSNNSFTWDFGDGTLTTTTSSATSHVYTVPGHYLPKLLVIDTALNCKVSFFGEDTIKASGALTQIKSHPRLFCDSTTLQFLDSTITSYDTITSYTWNFGDGSVSNEQKPTHKFDTPGVFPVSLALRTAAGCTASAAGTSVKIVKSPQVEIKGPAVTCGNQAISFSGSLQPDTSAVSWLWQFESGNTSNAPSPAAQTYTTPGTYSVNLTVLNSSGCVTQQSASIKVHPLPNVDAGQDSVICRGTFFTLHPTGADTYLWRTDPSLSCTSCQNPVASPVDTALYYVTGTNTTTACKNSDSIKIVVAQPFKVTAVRGDSICIGQSVQLFATGADYFTWTPAKGLSNTNTRNPVARPDTTTLYTVTGHDRYNCFTHVAYVPVTVYPVPAFNIIDESISLAAGSTATIKTASSPDITNWHWFPPTGLSCQTCPQPVVTASNNTSYTAVASNPAGCRAEDRVTIQVFCNNGNIFIPNTFSPNNDGANDVFFIRGRGIASVKSLSIFSRWGAVVFQKTNFSANDTNAAWDGTYNGKKLDPDVFVYHAEIICETGQIFSLKGDITLIR